MIYFRESMIVGRGVEGEREGGREGDSALSLTKGPAPQPQYHNLSQNQEVRGVQPTEPPRYPEIT